MAEAVVISLLKALSSALATEALKQSGSALKALAEVEDKIKQISREFEVMQAFLRHADMHNNDSSNPLARSWVKLVRRVAFDIEDIIDEHTYLVSKNQQRKGFTRHLCYAFHRSKNIASWYDLSSRLQNALLDLRQVSEIKDRYGISGALSGSSDHDELNMAQKLADTAHFIQEEDIVGVEDQKSLMVNWLTGEGEPAERTIITLWGMGGVGKTTLVTSAYRSPKTTSHFESSAWVSVSQTYKRDDLLRKIIQEIQHKERNHIMLPNAGTMDYRTLVGTLHEYLLQRRYLLILDDVWSASVWSDINAAFPEGNCGSRIVITTRIQEVASLACGNRAIELEPLSNNVSWTLFCRNAFAKEVDQNCPEELEYWGRKIVGKCGGLPLALVITGRMLSLKQRVELEWKSVHDAFGQDMSSGSTEQLQWVSSILNLSVNDLPFHLRNCFLFCSMFPEDYEMRRNKLIRMWVAEGFVEARGESTMEEVAEMYLNQLIGRCMLQVVEWNPFSRLSRCRLHDVMRDVIVAKSREESFSDVYDAVYVDMRQRDASVRRLSFMGGKIPWTDNGGMAHLRSFHLFSSQSSSVISSSMISNFRLLKFLNLEDIPNLEVVPEQLTLLFNLCYLSLRNTDIKYLPRFLGRLQNLQTLDAWSTHLESIPNGIKDLRNLRHLIITGRASSDSKTFGYQRSVQLNRIGSSQVLQTLKYVHAPNKKVIQQLGNFRHMRTLSIMVRGMDCELLSMCITNMNLLRKLAITVPVRYGKLRLEPISLPPPLLQKLYLNGELEEGKLPPWINSLANLKSLSLLQSKLGGEDLLSSLSMLSKLANLHLSGAYDWHVLVFRQGWFPALKRIALFRMPHLCCIQIEKEALVNLEDMYLGTCPELKTVPQGIEYLSSLRIWHLDAMPSELLQNLMEEEVHLKIQHIPDIKFWVSRDSKWINEWLS